MPPADRIWLEDPASWPEDAAAWPGGEIPDPDPDVEPPDPDSLLLALDPDVGPPTFAESQELHDAGETSAGPSSWRVPEAMAAGFLHRNAAGWGPEYAVPSASGFAAGGPADTMQPGAVLATLTGRAWNDGLPQLSDDELIGLLGAARRVSSWQVALELAAVAELDARRMRTCPSAGDPRARHVSEEVAAALVLTGRAADLLLDFAAGLGRLPGVAAMLAAGIIDRDRALIFVQELAALPAADAAAIADRILPEASEMTTGQLRAALRRAILAHDPDAARRRRQKAAADARVEAWGEGSGNTAMAGRELSPASVAAADAHLTALARNLQEAGAAGTLDNIRADVFLALLSGQSPETLVPGLPANPGHGSQPGGSSAAGQPVLAWPDGPRGTIHLTLPLTTWLGLTQSPGMAGTTPVDADTGRDLARILATWPGTRWCLTVTDPNDRATGHACSASGPPGEPPAQAPPGGPTAQGPPDRSPPYGRPLPGPGPCSGSGSGGGPGSGSGLRGWAPSDVARWLAGLPISWLEAGTCTHQRQVRGYRPSARLRHLIAIRNPECAFPGCRRPARQCDDDHTIAYNKGGRTCECNLAPLCRRHHRAKQARGWHLDQPRPGTLTWTLPHGRRYVTRPARYPA